VVDSASNRNEYQESSWGESKGWPARKADVTAICEPIVYKTWEPRRLTDLWAFTAFYRNSFKLLGGHDVGQVIRSLFLISYPPYQSWVICQFCGKRRISSFFSYPKLITISPCFLLNCHARLRSAIALSRQHIST
jgi:hypothetical protein